MHKRIELIKGDITSLSVDAIVNAAKNSLLGGGGVDGAIHGAAGKALLNACRLLNGCETGQAKITPGFDLPANYVIHTVGPVWHRGKQGETELLASCYQQSLELAKENGCSSVAFPNISTGVYRFPKELAAAIAIQEIKQFLSSSPIPEKVIFVCFDDENFRIYRELLS
ncbi:MAG: O-acetyl-ADP-ribose deacetylase [Bacteroidales bacterium]|nr:O-acetyl-ADP-ribose deacetylase [Bacteroidota bacterium]MBL6949909.1 O-acetyl-ADP-ribose deacetylase [Bacteroidales bacterium]